jgi:hypothetical protein
MALLPSYWIVAGICLFFWIMLRAASHRCGRSSLPPAIFLYTEEESIAREKYGADGQIKRVGNAGTDQGEQSQDKMGNAGTDQGKQSQDKTAKRWGSRRLIVCDWNHGVAVATIKFHELLLMFYFPLVMASIGG